MRIEDFDACSLADTIVVVDFEKWVYVFMPQMSVRKGMIGIVGVEN